MYEVNANACMLDLGIKPRAPVQKARMLATMQSGGCGYVPFNYKLCKWAMLVVVCMFHNDLYRQRQGNEY